MNVCTALLAVLLLTLLPGLPADSYNIASDYEQDEDTLLSGRDEAEPPLLQVLRQLLRGVAGRSLAPRPFPDMASAVSGPEVSKRNDMGVLPPWNEFCRMLRIKNCRAAK